MGRHSLRFSKILRQMLTFCRRFVVSGVVFAGLFCTYLMIAPLPLPFLAPYLKDRFPSTCTADFSRVSLVWRSLSQGPVLEVDDLCLRVAGTGPEFQLFLPRITLRARWKTLLQTGRLAYGLTLQGLKLIPGEGAKTPSVAPTPEILLKMATALFDWNTQVSSEILPSKLVLRDVLSAPFESAWVVITRSPSAFVMVIKDGADTVSPKFHLKARLRQNLLSPKKKFRLSLDVDPCDLKGLMDKTDILSPEMSSLFTSPLLPQQVRAFGEMHLGTDGAGAVHSGVSLNLRAADPTCPTQPSASSTDVTPASPFSLTLTGGGEGDGWRVSHLELIHPDLTFHGTGGYKPSTSHPHEADLTFTGTFGNIDFAKLSVLWPHGLAEGARSWIVKNIPHGHMTTGQLTWTAKVGRSPEDGANTLDLLLDLKGLEVSFLDGMPPVHEVAGQARLTPHACTITLTEGTLEGQQVQKGTLVIDWKDTPETLALTLQLKGAVPSLLGVLSHEPLQYPQQLDLDPATFKGQVTTQLDVKFPLLKDLLFKDVTLKARSVIRKLGCPLPVKLGATPLPSLTQGNLTLDVTPHKLSVKGDVALGADTIGVDVQETFSTSGQKRRREVKLLIPHMLMENLGFGMGDWVGAGLFPVTITSVPSHPESLTLTVDFSPAALSLPFLNWSKASGLPAQLTATPHPFKNPQKSSQEGSRWRLGLHAPDLQVSGTVTLNMKGGKTALNLDTLKTGKTTCGLTVVTDSKESFLTLRGDAFDASGLLDTSPHKSKPSPRTPPSFSLWRATVELHRLYLGGALPLEKVEGSFEAQATPDDFQVTRASLEAQTSLKGNVARTGGQKGVARVSATLAPAGRGHKLSLKADNGGALLRALGWFENVTAGALTGEATRTKLQSPWDIHLDLQSLTIRKTSFLTKLLMTLSSPTAFLNLFSGDTTSFDFLKANMTWASPVLTIKRLLMRTVNSGISLMGTVTPPTKSLNLRGNIIPVYMLNRFLGAIPLLGDILTGGKDDGLGATRFYVSGTWQTPQIIINPINILTPGIIKKIIRAEDHTTVATSAARSKKNRQDKTP